MRVRFLNSCVSAVGTFTARREYELSDELAAGFIAAGHAVTVESIEEAVVPHKPTEEAVLPARKAVAPARKEAVAPARKKGKRR